MVREGGAVKFANFKMFPFLAPSSAVVWQRMLSFRLILIQHVTFP